jgi:Tfp pilus assembly protein PilN
MSQQVNLYNPIFLKKRKMFSSVTMAQALGLLLVGLLVFYGYARFQVANLQTESERSAKRMEAAQARVARLVPQFGPRIKSADIEAKIKQAEEDLQALDAVQGALHKGNVVSGSGFSPYFKALARQVVAGLWLTNFSISGGEMAISGRTVKPELVPDYIHRLGQEPVMQGRKFATLEMRQPEAAVTKEGKAGVVPPFVEFSLQSTPKATTP